MALIPVTLNTDSLVMTAGNTFEIRPGVIVGGHGIDDAITTNGNGSILRNYGIVLAGSGTFFAVAIDATGSSNITIHNAAGGQIFGAEVGVDLGINTLFNAGTITSNGIGVRDSQGSQITNIGTIGGFDTGVDTEGQLTNLGLIYGDFAVELVGFSQTVINAGTIQAVSDGAAVTLGSRSTLHNTGTISGDIFSDFGFFFTSDDQVINSGTIFGEISLRNGEDLYDGRLGKLLDGAVLLGEGDDTALGGAGSDSLDGGLGNDILDGGAGIDTADFTDLGLNPAGGAITVNLNLTGPQNTGQGFDTLIAIENLITDFRSDTLIGNAAANRFEASGGTDTLFGNAGNDVLLGQADNDTLAGGAGIDILNGGTGQDTFLFDTALAQAGIDKIVDFVVADNTIRLKKSVFTALGLGQLNAAAFRVVGSAAIDATDRIIYNKTTGQLFYDADGSGTAAAQIHFCDVHQRRQAGAHHRGFPRGGVRRQSCASAPAEAEHRPRHSGASASESPEPMTTSIGECARTLITSSFVLYR